MSEKKGFWEKGGISYLPRTTKQTQNIKTSRQQDGTLTKTPSLVQGKKHESIRGKEEKNDPLFPTAEVPLYIPFPRFFHFGFGFFPANQVRMYMKWERKRV